MRDMRGRLAATATQLLADDDRVAIILADISEDYFADAATHFPERVINVGIMEQALIGVAAGFALEGFHPIVHSIAPFLVERPYEQVKLDFGYQGLGGTLASIGASYDYGTEGGTHHAPADVGVMLQIPGTQILAPGTPDELASLLTATYANGALTYLRTSTSSNNQSLPVAPGSIHRIRTGSLAAVLAFGPMLTRTLVACEGLDVTICYTATVAPLDPHDLTQALGETPSVIAVEPWYEGTSLQVLAAALAPSPRTYHSIGVRRSFLRKYGSPQEHDSALGLDMTGIRQSIARVIAGGRTRNPVG